MQDLDGSSASITFIDAFRASMTFKSCLAGRREPPSARSSSNAARAVLIIPPHFGRDMARGVSAQVQLLVDASDANTAKLLSGDASKSSIAYNIELASTGRSAPVVAAMRLWFNPGRDSKKF